MASQRRGPRGYVPPRRGAQRTTLRPSSGPFRGFVFRSQADHDRQWAAYRTFLKLNMKPDRRRIWKLSERFMFLFEEAGEPKASFFYRNLPTSDELNAFLEDLRNDPRYPSTLSFRQAYYKVG